MYSLLMENMFMDHTGPLVDGIHSGSFQSVGLCALF